MRTFWIAFVVALVAVRVVSAQPVSFKLQGSVAAGEKPQLQVSAAEKVTDLRLELERSDGKKFQTKHASIDKGQTAALPIGDGATGKSSYKGTLSMQLATGKRWTEQLTFDTLVGGGVLKVAYDAEHLDLDKHVLQFKPTRPIATAELTVIGDDGKELAKNKATFTDAKPDEWLSITWNQPANTRVMILRLRAAASDGAATNVELIPWSVSIDHEDVNFVIDSAKIDPTEGMKLDMAITRIQDVAKKTEKVMPMRLYIAGHTDTVGPSAKNRKLSLARALAIATYFRKHGIKMPIAFAGFGEDVLKVKTADNADEAANRRVDYVIGPAAGAPPFKGAYLKVKADWKQLK